MKFEKPYFLLIIGDFCSKCKIVKPLIEAKAKELGYNYYEIENNEENLPLTNELGLEYLPTIFVGEKDQPMMKRVGVLRIKNYLLEL